MDLNYFEYKEKFKSTLKSYSTILWLCHKNKEEHLVSNEEKYWSKKLSKLKASTYLKARGYARYSLSNLFNINPLEIPLSAPPGKEPKLNMGWGNISISHCEDAILIGWSPNRLGIDIERKDRSFKAKKLLKRISMVYEEKSLKGLSSKDLNQLFLKDWVIKEACYKWQETKNVFDIFNWHLENDISYAKNLQRKMQVKVNLIKYKSWYISVANNSTGLIKYPIICVS